MKKIIIYATVLLLVTVITVSGTYAFFAATTTTGNMNNMGTHQVQVRYSGDVKIDGFIDLARNKEEGFRRTVKIGKADDSVPVTASIYIYLANISEGFANKALKWEIYEVNGEEEVPIENGTGTFEGYQSGDKIYMIKNFELSEDLKEYAIYLWLNGHEAGNEVIGASLTGYIGAESSIVTGDLE